MQFEKKMILILAAFSLMAVPVLASDNSDATQDYTRDYGEFYSYTLQFVFDGSDAQTIEWDFGDGTPVSTAWNPQHTYAQKGIYYVTQTTTNTIGSTVEIYKVSVKGFPVISFQSNGGSAVDPIQMNGFSQVAVKPTDPTKANYDFAGWYKDEQFSQSYNWGSNVVESFTLYAKWVQSTTPSVCEVTFDVNGGSSTVTKRIVANGSDITLPAYSGTKSGYEFIGWSNNNVAYQPGSSVTVSSNMVFKAVWKSTTLVSTCSVSFDVNGGSITIPSMTFVPGSNFVFPSYEGTKDGFVFSGWEYGSKVYKPGNTISFVENTSVKAVWTPIDNPDAQKDVSEQLTDFLKEPVSMAFVGIVLLAFVGFMIARHRRF